MATLAYPVLANGIEKPALKNFPLATTSDLTDERFWEQVKKQFTVPPNLMIVNAANLCPSPYFINDLVTSTMDALEKDVSFHFRHQFAEKRAKAIEAMAQFVRVGKDEIGIVRNTSEGNAIVVQGLDFKAGDEILLWDQNHASNGIAWEQQARRYGFVIKKITTPAALKSAEELTAAFLKAVTPKTKLISFSHISSSTGIALPAKEICQMAKAKKILTQVDGAQSLGMMVLNLKDIGCDFYTASTHKWLMGPFENGIIYVSKERLEQLWPNVISAGWKEGSATADEKFCVLGQRNETTPFALLETLEFHQSIGEKNIENRVKKLTSYLKEQVQSKVPQVTINTPLSPALSGGIVSLSFGGKPTQEIYQKLYERHGIACSTTGGIRLSPHIYNTLEDMDRITAALAVLAA